MSAIFTVPNEELDSVLTKLSAFTLNHEEYVPYARSKRRYEVHRDFIDVQFVRDGFEDIAILQQDAFGVAPQFDGTNDVAFFADDLPEDVLVHLHPGLFCVIFPGEAHMPCLAQPGKTGPVQKCVAKIPLKALLAKPLLFREIFPLF